MRSYLFRAPSTSLHANAISIGGRLLQGTDQRQRRVIGTTVSAVGNDLLNGSVHGHVYNSVPMSVPLRSDHSLMAGAAVGMDSVIAAATTAAAAATTTAAAAAAAGGTSSASRKGTRRCLGSFGNSSVSMSRSGVQGEAESSAAPESGLESGSDRQATRLPSPAGVPRANVRFPSPLLASSGIQGLPAFQNQRRSYSTSTSSPFSSNSFSASSSSSSPSPPDTDNSHINQDANSPRSGTEFSIDFDRLAALIPNQSPTGINSVWFIVAAASLLAFHKEAAVGELWKYISQRCEGEGERESRNDIAGDDARSRQLGIARRIRESCLKASVLVGFPRGINALLALQASLSTTSNPVLATLQADKPLRTLSTFPTSESRYARGKQFFSQIYANHTERVLASMGASSAGDLSYFAISSIYGELMAETSILDGRETVLLEFACCLADGVGPQAKGHFFGCKNLSVSGEEIRGAIEIVREIARQLELTFVLEEVGEGFERGEGEFRFLKRASSW
ncbi:hypothetical protein PAAG_11739 [Paracoccidioides lutzii Pb01]|uniref:Uncharacterized protein n=1 Tax=Paracoccidioides lutzii (strain ATCC MYA-826 / Pb01) TaxID=502779 RepID=A0A0A2VKT8_PARBA|nr:hypothetical protein PAAG_11739 [Paracoccidioides lutzii Pb01]KGQ01504.1 hypothetical protein PAAG_11739 [Paracoccidioides lutzii Pb01]